ncbi:MAG TPA: bifunctional folylpolyglutamate synthase/dihydrofolate synthase [Cyanobacteria bacterium UBA11159]|nr:bifunctional folylpolyglutamate synthase/dihydrofolate synthase [Cyanobacteria bacterium UBA11366]HBK66494.1 bifunctional folylpolyglutamate synthase/dihydrofolate synthase [Cyanobacteria bacterium UBA11166]HBR74534.1 bifunctional folylpolyglutamate synthase/dihydrofolate synthase [Cyanobacteria bacterium UBA11159]HBS70455.1 bifunctional folylpolyglutamate synthase/dihydrofolate synthase [Cyanobacteria bacterium UBA11153]HCA96602.1 bifunctional folylpolyglutamate synthase/dihydrofolate synth
MNPESILQTYQHFGIQLGLNRIHQLLNNLGNPHHQIPIIHVAGTNGKGSVCAYLSSILTEAGYKTGRYTSPHLIDWTERICINQKPILTEDLTEIILQVQNAIGENGDDSPTQFEMITAVAWLYFARKKVDVAVIEVGLGGRLDATNVCDSPLASIITSISREHWQILGPTLGDIAREKAGILKENCPVIIGNLPPEAKAVVEERIKELNCPAIWVQPAIIQKSQGKSQKEKERVNKDYPQSIPHFQVLEWAEYEGIKYPLPLLGEIQLMNSAIAISAIKLLQTQGWHISEEAIATGMAKTIWPGRLQWITWHNRSLLIDGAHNRAAAQALRHYVDSFDTAITWVMGILASKDHRDIFTELLRPQDRLYLVPVPDSNSADPEELKAIAQTVCSELTECHTYLNLDIALQSAILQDNLIVICGSLYLIGDFLKLIVR